MITMVSALIIGLLKTDDKPQPLKDSEIAKKNIRYVPKIRLQIISYTCNVIKLSSVRID